MRAYLTPDLPGTGGVLRRSIEDFRVDEVPIYDACGEGEHLYLRVRKRGVATFEAMRRIAEALGVPERNVGYAGLKDARAVTSQWFSVLGAREEQLSGLALPRLEILDQGRHANKLRIGHLRANRFSIVVRDAAPDAVDRAAAIVDRLVRRGAPNYFGEQRFGTRGTTHLCGEALLRKDDETFVRLLLGGEPGPERNPRVIEARRLFDAGRLREAYETMPTRQRAEKKCLHALIRFDDTGDAVRAIPKRMRQMYISSFQSWLFNRILERRLDELDSIRKGDLAYIHRSTKIFPVEDIEAEQVRCRAFEISASGPLFGTRTPLATDAPGALERSVLDETGLRRADFDLGNGLKFKGLRRPLRIPLKDVALRRLDATSLRVEFVLPSGCYATSVMREIVKPGVG